MIKANVREARQNLSHLLDQVENGEEVIISRRNHIVARIIPYVEQKTLKSLPMLKTFRDSIEVTGKSLSQMISDERANR